MTPLQFGIRERMLQAQQLIRETSRSLCISAMPEGRRRSGLAAGAEALFAEEFAGRVLVFGGAAARLMPRLSFFVARPANPSKPSTR